MANEKTQKQMIHEIHEAVIQQGTVLLGVPGTEDGGLVQEVRDIKLNAKELGQSHGKLKRNFYILIGTLAGSGAIGTGIYGALNGG